MIFWANVKKLLEGGVDKYIVSRLESYVTPGFPDCLIYNKVTGFFTVEYTLKDFMKNGTAGRKSAFLNRDDIGGKTGTTNDAVSTWFSGFHDDLVTTVWVGTDDFTSLGDNEYGSTISMPIWLDYMSVALNDLEEKPVRIPPGMTYIKVDKETGEINNSQNSKNSYFELFLDENIKN